MSLVLYLKFPDALHAEHALTARVGRGANLKNLTGLLPYRTQIRDTSPNGRKDMPNPVAESPGGLGVVGDVLTVTSVSIPGFALVAGGSTLVGGLFAKIEGNFAESAARGVAGYLQDHGVPEGIASQIDEILKSGGAAIVLELPTGLLAESEALDVIGKYSAEVFGRSQDALC